MARNGVVQLLEPCSVCLCLGTLGPLGAGLLGVVYWGLAGVQHSGRAGAGPGSDICRDLSGPTHVCACMKAVGCWALVAGCIRWLLRVGQAGGFCAHTKWMGRYAWMRRLPAAAATSITMSWISSFS